jgi:hypothetical protein
MVEQKLKKRDAIKRLQEWNEEVEKILKKRGKSNPDYNLWILDGISRQNDVLAEQNVVLGRIDTQVCNMFKTETRISHNITYILAILSIITTFIIGFSIWLATHI